MAGARFVLGTCSYLGPYWVRLSLRSEAGTLDILLVRDQLAPVAWARLVARLRRVQSCEGVRKAPMGGELR
jgi:hypothetical protein